MFGNTIEDLRQVISEEVEKAFAKYYRTNNENDFVLKRNSHNNGDLLTRQEASAFLGLKENTLAVWASKNTGPAPCKIGSRVMYRKSELEAFITKNTMPRTPKGGHHA